VKNQAAFESRYGTGLNILGVYASGSLDNGGELVAIANGFNQTLQTFTYDDDWYPSTDGGGYSLVIRNANDPMSNWDLQSGWRASYGINGSPAANDTDFVAPTMQSGNFNSGASQVQLTFSEPIALGSGIS